MAISRHGIRKTHSSTGSKTQSQTQKPNGTKLFRNRTNTKLGSTAGKNVLSSCARLLTGLLFGVRNADSEGLGECFMDMTMAEVDRWSSFRFVSNT